VHTQVVLSPPLPGAPNMAGVNKRVLQSKPFNVRHITKGLTPTKHARAVHATVEHTPSAFGLLGLQACWARCWISKPRWLAPSTQPSPSHVYDPFQRHNVNLSHSAVLMSLAAVQHELHD